MRYQPKNGQKRARRSNSSRKDPSNPELHFKQVVSSKSYWSIRFGDAMRAIGVRTGADIEWIWIGDHTEYEQIIHGTHR